MVPSDGLDLKRIEPCCFGLMFEESGTGCGQVENFDHLSADTTREVPVASNRILSSHSSLLVRCRAERQVFVLLQDSVPRLDTVPGCVNIGDVGLHRRVYLDCAFLSCRDSRIRGELRDRPYTRGDENQVRRLLKSIRSRNSQAVRRCNPGYFDIRSYLDVVPPQLISDYVSQLWVNCVKNRFCPTDQSDL